MTFSTPLNNTITLFNADCIDAMRLIPSDSVDMVLCDLPYGTTKNKWDEVIPFAPLWEQYCRIARQNAAIVLFADGLFTARLALSNEKMWRYNMVWDKQRCCDFLNANVKPLKCHEDICVFYRSKPTYNKQCWQSTPYARTPSFAKSDNYGHWDGVGSKSESGDRNPLTILSFPRDGKREHPTQKPVALLEWLIKTYTNEGDTVLDNCMGSGSTGVAAANTRRNFIGIELDPHYFKVARGRIANEARIS